MTKFVYVRWKPDHSDSQKEPLSYEPKKWYRILHERIFCPEIDSNGIRQMIKSCWLSEFGTSLNLMVDIPLSRADAQQVLDSLATAFIGALEVGVPVNTVIPVPKAAEIVLFPQRQAA
jgi:hypothetical protein